MSYRATAAAFIGTLAVTAAMAAAEPGKSTAATPPGAQAPVQQAPAKSEKGAAPTPSPSTHPPVGSAPQGPGPKPVPKKPTAPEKLVDINHASPADLKKDLNISDEVANKIVAARPLNSKTDLVTKAGLPEGIYLSLRHRIVINTTKKPTAKKAVTSQPVSQAPEPKK